MSKYLYGERTLQRKAAIKRMADAQCLSAGSRWRGAMYLAGYAVECSLKVKLMERYGVVTLKQLEEKLAKRIRGSRRPDLRHNIEVLFFYTGAQERLIASGGNDVLRSYAKCNEWKVDWRYSGDDGTQDSCQVFMDAVQTFIRFIQNSV